jgi:hypothetical protein
MFTVTVMQCMLAQQRRLPSSTGTRSASTQVNNQPRLPMTRRMVPIPKRINLMQFRRNITGFGALPANGTANTVSRMNNSNNNTNSRDRLVRNSHLLNPANYTLTKTYSDGSKGRFTLTGSIGSWDSKSVYTYGSKQKSSINGDPGWNCVSTTETFNAQSTSFLNANPNEKGSHLVPGAIYSFDDYSSGNFREYSDDRNQVTVYTTTTVGTNSAAIQNPNAQSLSQGVSNIASQFTPDQAGSTQIIQTTSVDNQADYAIQISAGGSYGAFSGSASFSHAESEHHIYFTISAIKPMYTMSVQRPGNGYFADGKTPNANSPLIVVQDVTYGARILANLDITITNKTDLGSLGISYNDGMESANLNFNAVAEDKTIKYTLNAYMVGVQVHSPMTTLKDFEAQIASIFSQADYHSAAPIQYGLSDLDGNALGIESATDKFTTRTCTPADEVYTLQSIMATVETGEDGKNDNSEFWLELYSGLPANLNKFAVFYDNRTEFNKQNTPTLNIPFLNPSRPITLTDFKDGGALLLRLSEHGHSRDDWDINSLNITFNFVSQKGTRIPKTIPIQTFRFSDKSNAVFYFNGNFGLAR